MVPPQKDTGETTAQQMQGYIDNIDKYTQATNNNVLPTEQSLLDARRQIQPQQSQFELDNARQFLPQFTQLGLDQQAQQSQGQAANDAALLNGSGRDLVKANLSAQQLADPEYYKTRQQTGDQISRLYGSLDDPNGGLSGTERAEIDRSLARDNVAKGIDSPTNTSAVQSAMQFGAAGAKRKADKQQAINAAVQTAGNVMPTLKSGVDVLQLTTGRPSTNNVGLGQMGANREVGAATQNMGQNLFNQIGENSRQTADINSKKRTAFDSVMSVMNSTGNLASSI